MLRKLSRSRLFLLLLHDHWSIVFVVDCWVAQLMRISRDCSQRGRSNERVIATHDACAISNMSDGFALLKSAYGQSGHNPARIASLEPTRYQASLRDDSVDRACRASKAPLHRVDRTIARIESRRGWMHGGAPLFCPVEAERARAAKDALPCVDRSHECNRRCHGQRALQNAVDRKPELRSS